MRSSNGPGDLGAIALDLQRRASALLLRIGEKAAGAGFHGGDEHEIGRVIDGADSARDGDVSVL